MPDTAVDGNRDSLPSKDEVGFKPVSSDRPCVLAKSESETVQCRSERDFWTRVA
jgi:hypothetical protein